MKKTVLITGAYGFIGRYVARFYNAENYNVIGIGHGTWSSDEWVTWGLSQWHKCDITLESLLKYGSRPDVILHCAGSGSVGFSLNYPMQDFERTVRTTQFILEYVRLHSPQTIVVYPSSAAVYGIADQIPIKEESTLQPISPYGVNKKIAEDLCLMYARQYSLSIAIVRLFSVYGIGLKKQLLWDACKKIERGDFNFFGTGLETRDWIHVNDVASLLYIASKNADKSVPIVNGGTGHKITVGEVLEKVFAAFGKEDGPQFLENEDVGNPAHYLADTWRVKGWNWEPHMTLEQGINDYVSWFKGGIQ